MTLFRTIKQFAFNLYDAVKKYQCENTCLGGQLFTTVGIISFKSDVCGCQFNSRSRIHMVNTDRLRQFIALFITLLLPAISYYI